MKLSSIEPVRALGRELDRVEGRFKQADAWGRELARADFQKKAHAEELFEVGEKAGRLMAKTALDTGMLSSGLRSAGTALMKNLPKDPHTLIGAGIGAAGGLASGLRKDEHGNRSLLGGLTGAATGAALGGAAGYAGKRMSSALGAGMGVGDAAKAIGQDALSRAKNVGGAFASGMQGAAPTSMGAGGALAHAKTVMSPSGPSSAMNMMPKGPPVLATPLPPPVAPTLNMGPGNLGNTQLSG